MFNFIHIFLPYLEIQTSFQIIEFEFEVTLCEDQ